MKLIKRIFNILFIFIILFTIIGCKDDDIINTPEVVVEELTIISVNDFHGALEQNSDGRYGAARLAYLIEQERKSTEASVLISAGDMFQGTAISSYTRGKAVIDVMNEMDFDVMNLGNHEFDWGYDEIYKYVDGDLTNGEAEFPYLGCNIIEKSTNNILKGVKPYEILSILPKHHSLRLDAAAISL